jgi:hypothetical protein
MNRQASMSLVSVLIIGLLLSAIMIVPSIRIVPFGLFSIIFHILLLGALSLPFLIIYFFFRSDFSHVVPITLGATFSLCHAYLIYVSYARAPQEFGYVGLLFAPLLEAVVAIPVAIIVILVIKRVNPQAVLRNEPGNDPKECLRPSSAKSNVTGGADR